MSAYQAQMNSLFVEAMDAFEGFIESEKAETRRRQAAWMRRQFVDRVRELQGLPKFEQPLTIWRPTPYVSVQVSKTEPDYRTGAPGEFRIDTTFGSAP